MNNTCETCAKRETCTKTIGTLAGFCNTDYQPQPGEDNSPTGSANYEGTEMYQVRYGQSANFKVIKANHLEQAERIYTRAKSFAESHRLPWTIALWCDGWLIRSETVQVRKETVR